MRSNVLITIILVIFLGCGKPEQLAVDEQQYVLLTVSLTTMRAQTPDSLQLNQRLDSTFKAFGMNKKQYQDQGEALVNTPDRSEMIFRAINDSLSKPRK